MKTIFVYLALFVLMVITQNKGAGSLNHDNMDCSRDEFNHAVYPAAKSLPDAIEQPELSGENQESLSGKFSINLFIIM